MCNLESIPHGQVIYLRYEGDDGAFDIKVEMWPYTLDNSIHHTQDICGYHLSSILAMWSSLNVAHFHSIIPVQVEVHTKMGMNFEVSVVSW